MSPSRVDPNTSVGVLSAICRARLIVAGSRSSKLLRITAVAVSRTRQFSSSARLLTDPQAQLQPREVETEGHASLPPLVGGMSKRLIGEDKKEVGKKETKSFRDHLTGPYSSS